MLSGSGLRCSVSHLNCFIGYLFSVSCVNDLKLNRKTYHLAGTALVTLTVLGFLKIYLFWIEVTQNCFQGGFSVGYIFAGSEKVFSE